MPEESARDLASTEPGPPSTIETDAEAVDARAATAAVVSSDYKVRGEIDAPDGTGVLGHNTATSGAAVGVEGVTQSPGSGAVGVRGSTANDNVGVLGQAYDSEVDLESLASFESAGVFGRTDKPDGWGVVAWSNNKDGLFGRTDDPGSYGVYGYNSNPDGYGVGTFGSLYVDDHVDVNDVGLSAYRSSNQTIDSGSHTTVVFDGTNVDHFGGYSTSTGVYTVQVDGDYHVSFTIDWQTTFSAGVNIHYELRIDGDSSGGIQADTTTATSSQRVCRNFSRTLFDLTRGTTLEVVVAQDSGSTADVWGSNQESYLTLYKVG